MSIESWKKEFYPISAKDLVQGKPAPVEIVQHSLTKWQGLQKSKLARHGVVAGLHTITNAKVPAEGYLTVAGTSSCSLCQDAKSNCNNCHIVKATGERCSPQWGIWMRTKDPKPMIKLLKLVLKKVKEKTKKQEKANA